MSSIEYRKRLKSQILLEIGVQNIIELYKRSGASRRTVFNVKNRLKRNIGIEKKTQS